VKYGILAVIVLLLAVRVVRVVRRRRARTDGPAPSNRRSLGSLERVGSDIGLVALREIRERVKSRVYRVGTLIILLAVIAAVVIPTLNKGKTATERVGAVGTLSVPQRDVVVSAAESLGVKAVVATEPSLARAKADLRSGHLALVVVDGSRLVVDQAITPTDTSTTALFARAVSGSLGLANGLSEAGLTGEQILKVAHAPPLAVSSLQPPKRNSTERTTTLYGVILIYILLTQYGTWLLMGVVEEKSSRVIEVLLSTLRPVQLLAGKVVGIGATAFIQSALIVAAVLISGAASGSDLLHGSTPLTVVVILAWLVLAYGFYCWIWAAAGSLVERQSQVQSLAFPLQLPVIFGYIVSLIALASGNASTLVKVLAYLPPTAPFAMPTLVTLGQATWWEDLLSAGITIVAIAGVVRLSSYVYYQAILQTGGRVRLAQIFTRTKSTPLAPVSD
jgi:ABC-2 type transport system permease protein